MNRNHSKMSSSGTTGTTSSLTHASLERHVIDGQGWSGAVAGCGHKDEGEVRPVAGYAEADVCPARLLTAGRWLVANRAKLLCP